MGSTKNRSTAEKFQQILDQGPQETYLLRLYVAGTSPASARAIKNIRRICEEHLPGRYHLEVIDLYQQPELKLPECVVTAPTLIKELPPPLRCIIGDMSNTSRVLAGLDIKVR
ncbi:KaiB domain protein [Desulfonatronospira thiodismutans ASO3-1]|uniref:KaiB domain protein n=1 Tax=Desulfonatronospira thiodismutans ASO3-1 TaxID=555779 RepID=D6SSH5_9BACT|nr:MULTISPECIES: circadian clock KaiB family protein [Desulfonatronospira]EFI33641.1 KaiB domain protein [Desulfonatronospira thiodismutans ASO3-1]RQD74013.1 MAG: thiol-disulfide isomerase [Desulfonatronospira sp. MSAO_Bac3]